MDTQAGPDTWKDLPNRRHHDAEGISPEAYAVINQHGLCKKNILSAANTYEGNKGGDFNEAPAYDFESAPLGSNLTKMVDKEPAFDPYQDKFREALNSLDYSTSDSIIVKGLKEGIIVNQAGNSIYRYWKRHVELLEGLNVALFRVAMSAVTLQRFIGSLDELDNYMHGRWRKMGDLQDRVPTTVGASNRFLGDAAVARITFTASAIRDWTQAVRYSPYPRNPHQSRERFGSEKSGHLAGEGEVHVHARCPIPARGHIKIALLARSSLGRQEVIERYGGVGIVE